MGEAKGKRRVGLTPKEALPEGRNMGTWGRRGKIKKDGPSAGMKRAGKGDRNICRERAP